MPIHDWQFWVVTIIAIGSLWLLKIVLLPKKKGTKTTLTVGGKPVGKESKRKSKDCGCS
tara:strand:+ start:103395 stop:103571 length:177 start_codon:yes stop_codon:yes gene_type:complete